MIKNTILLRLVFIIVFPVPGHLSAQGDAMRWGRIPDSDLHMTVYVPDPEADAVILAQVVNTEIDVKGQISEVKTEYHFRIKYLTQTGVERYGDRRLSDRLHGRQGVNSKIQAQVFLPDGSRVQAGKDHIFSQRDGKHVSDDIISLPALEPGAVAEYRYTKVRKDLFQPVQWYFQSEIPVVYGELQVVTPEWFDYVVINQGRKIDDEQYAHKIVNVARSMGQRARDPRASTVQRTFQVVMNHAVYKASNVPALHTEPMITSMNNYYASIRYQLRAFRYEESPDESAQDTWPELEQELLTHANFGSAYLSPANGNAVLNAAGLGGVHTGTPRERAIQLYGFLQNYLQWNGNTGITMRQSVADVLKNRQGSAAELNLVFLAGLLRLGIDAAPVLTATRSNGGVLEVYPFLGQFNYVLIVADFDGEQSLFDLSGAYLPAGFPNPIALNYRGWKVIRDRSAWIDVAPPASNSSYHLELDCAPDGTLSGTLRARYEGYHGAHEREHFGNTPNDYAPHLLRYAERSWRYAELQILNTDAKHLPLEVSCSVQAEAQSETGSLVYISPVVPDLLTINPFKAVAREFPVEFHYPYALHYTINVKVPEGYHVESLPDGHRVRIEGGGIDFSFRVSEADHFVQWVIDFSLTEVRFSADKYDALRKFFDVMRSSLSERVVLRR